MILARMAPPVGHFPTVTTIVNALQDFTEKIVKLSSMLVTEIHAPMEQPAKSWKLEDSRKNQVCITRQRQVLKQPPSYFISPSSNGTSK